MTQPRDSRGTPVARMKAKVCTVGERHTGKTELIRRFVLGLFDDRYIQTLGTKVSKKLLSVPNPSDGEIAVDMTIWDIMGHEGFRGLLKDEIFYGAKGILAVCNVAHRETLEDLDEWIETVYSVAGRIPIVLAINRVGLSNETEITELDAKRFSDKYGAPYLFTSAIEGENVETVFRSLARLIVENRLRTRTN